MLISEGNWSWAIWLDILIRSSSLLVLQGCITVSLWILPVRCISSGFVNLMSFQMKSLLLITTKSEVAEIYSLGSKDLVADPASAEPSWVPCQPELSLENHVILALWFFSSFEFCCHYVNLISLYRHLVKLAKQIHLVRSLCCHAKNTSWHPALLWKIYLGQSYTAQT